MNLITSASSEMYKQAFSPGLRNTVNNVNSTDILILVLIAILIVYLLAKAFQGPCRTVCHKICPIPDNTEHMASFGGMSLCHISESNITFKTSNDELKVVALEPTNEAVAKVDELIKFVKGVSDVSSNRFLFPIPVCSPKMAVIDTANRKVNGKNTATSATEEITLPKLVDVQALDLVENPGTNSVDINIVDPTTNAQISYNVPVSLLKTEEGFYNVKLFKHQ